jgi:hypothetical protein
MKNTLILLKSWGTISNAERVASYNYPKDVTISTGSKNLESIKPNHECKSLVPYSNGLGSTVGMRLPISVLTTIKLTPEALSIFAGSLLGDGGIRKPTSNGAPQWRCNVGLIHIEYLLFLFSYLIHYCAHTPSMVRRRDGTFYCHLITRSLPCLNQLLDAFAVEGKKFITMAIAEYITPLALAIWAQDDGTRTPEGFYLCSNGFSLIEQQVLQRILWINFGIRSTIHKHLDGYKLYIPVFIPSLMGPDLLS